MKKNLWLAAMCFFVPLVFSGCAAIEARNIDGSGRPYIGARTDAWHVSHPAEADTMGEPIFCAVDLPFSAVIDTLCLPYDLVEKKQAKEFNPHAGQLPGE